MYREIFIKKTLSPSENSFQGATSIRLILYHRNSTGSIENKRKYEQQHASLSYLKWNLYIWDHGEIRDWVIAFDVTLYSRRVLEVKTFSKNKRKEGKCKYARWILNWKCFCSHSSCMHCCLLLYIWVQVHSVIILDGVHMSK